RNRYSGAGRPAPRAHRADVKESRLGRPPERTIKHRSRSITSLSSDRRRAMRHKAASRRVLFFFEIFQFFLQSTFRQYVLQFAPSRLALLGGCRGARTSTPPSCFDESVVARLLVAVRDEFIVEIEVIVVSLHHALLHPTDSNTAKTLPIGHPTPTASGESRLLAGRSRRAPEKTQ